VTSLPRTGLRARAPGPRRSTTPPRSAPLARAVGLACVALAVGCGVDTAVCPSAVAVDPGVRATARDVQPILARSCALGGCHLRAPGAGGLVFELTSAAWTAAVVGVRAQANPAMALVAPGHPERSWLVAKLDGAFCGATCDPVVGCGAAMPFGEPLPEADRAMIVAWIRDGAP